MKTLVIQLDVQTVRVGFDIMAEGHRVRDESNSSGNRKPNRKPKPIKHNQPLITISVLQP